MSFKCDTCKEHYGGTPHIVPTGFKKDGVDIKWGCRLGEAQLCSKCALQYERSKDDMVEVRNGFRYAMFMQGTAA